MKYTAQELLQMVSVADDTNRVMENIRATMKKLADANGDNKVFEEVMESMFTLPRADALLLAASLSIVAQRDGCWPSFMMCIETAARKRTN